MVYIPPCIITADGGYIPLCIITADGGYIPPCIITVDGGYIPSCFITADGGYIPLCIITADGGYIPPCPTLYEHFCFQLFNQCQIWDCSLPCDNNMLDRMRFCLNHQVGSKHEFIASKDY
jgi:plastocyanin domain-containing protein